MVIKPSTAIRNDYAGISALVHAEDTPVVLTKNGESDLLRLKAKPEAAEQARLSGQTGFSLEASKARLEEIYG